MAPEPSEGFYKKFLLVHEGQRVRKGDVSAYLYTPPEVTGEVGRRATALVYAIVESGRLGRPVTLDEVERVEVDGYQREIDQHLGLI